MLRRWEFSQPGVEGLGGQPIRFQGSRNSANPVSTGWDFSQLHDFGVPLSSNQVFRAGSSANQALRGWEFSQSGFEGLGVQPIMF